jgi:NADH:ubiquinone oxidoreductase subunit 5 (subunit L)/multisubunit Na+/H+ antiporter MnhA subunit
MTSVSFRLLEHCLFVGPDSDRSGNVKCKLFCFSFQFFQSILRIIALSTLNQLGLIIGAVSVGLVSLAFFHLLTHALFKALLFMCASVIIHTIKDSQDIRFMGNLSIQIPFTSVCLSV